MDGLATKWLGREFEYLGEVTSTDDYLKEHAGELENGAAVVAERQTRGKGRTGREWQGGDGLAMSFLLHNPRIADLTCLPLVAGMAVIRALERAAGSGFGLKWSNDVLFGDKKICGILCESRISSHSAFAVAGIGVNLSQTREEFDALGLVYATSLELATGARIEKTRFAAMILNEFEPLYEKFAQSGFSAIRENYKSYCVTLGKRVRVITKAGEREGEALDIAEDGSLVCEIGGKLVHVRAGEASVRGLYGYA